MSRETRVRSMKKRRQVGMAFMVLALAAMMIPTALAKGPKKTEAPVNAVEICHVNGASDIIPGKGNPDNLWAFGQKMMVPEAALASHVAHGDLLADSPNARDEYSYDGKSWENLNWSADYRGLKIWKHADCAVLTNP